jgi:hypothetical protein
LVSTWCQIGQSTGQGLSDAAVPTLIDHEEDLRVGDQTSGPACSKEKVKGVIDRELVNSWKCLAMEKVEGETLATALEYSRVE